jgi:glyoxalase family protein
MPTVAGTPTLSFHHATSFAGSLRANIQFYRQTLGLRLVKRTVNFDEPFAHHLYYSSSNGSPGSVLTFFPGYQHRTQARQKMELTLTGALPGASSTLTDPDGQILRLLPGEGPLRLHSVALKVADPEKTRDFFHSAMGWETSAAYMEAPGGGARVQIVEDPEASRPRFGAGIVHHIAFCVEDEAAQLAWREHLIKAGVRVSLVKDRHYFHSIYFREPGGLLLEIATHGPGFLIDESEDQLGHSLMLPPWFEPIREKLEARLKPFEEPDVS